MELTELERYAYAKRFSPETTHEWFRFCRFWCRLAFEMHCGARAGMFYAHGVTGVTREGRRDAPAKLRGAPRVARSEESEAQDLLTAFHREELRGLRRG